MEKRFEQGAYRRLLGAVEKVTGKHFTDAEMSEIARGASEEDLVNSGLEETMVTAYQQLIDIREVHQREITLRTAALINAIDKIAASYEHLGIFP
jgi:glutamate dehydrogenase (NAD(P)+)